MKRQPGYYWVKDRIWMIGEYKSTGWKSFVDGEKIYKWFLPDSMVALDDEEFQEIDETKITRKQ
jgi:hypothetical protein